MKNPYGKVKIGRWNMKSLLKLGLVLTVSMFGSMGAGSTAYAQVQPSTSHSGAVCQETNQDGSHKVKYWPWGDVESDQLYEVFVTCPLTRARQENENGAEIVVYVTHVGSQTTFCKAYSRNSDGTSLAFDQEGWTGSGNGKVILDLAYAGASDYLSYYVVNCKLPAEGEGRLKSILLKEFL